MRYVCHIKPESGGPDGRNFEAPKTGRLTELARARRSRAKKNEDPGVGPNLEMVDLPEVVEDAVPMSDIKRVGNVDAMDIAGHELMQTQLAEEQAATGRFDSLQAKKELAARAEARAKDGGPFEWTMQNAKETALVYERAHDLATPEIGPQAVEAEKATESWFGAMTKGAREMSAAAGRLLKEIDDKVGIKDGWKYGWKNLKDVFKGETATDWDTGKSHLSGELAASTLAELATELGVEPRAKQATDTSRLERTRQTAKYILGGFIGESMSKSPEAAAISKQDKKELTAFMKEAGNEPVPAFEQAEAGDEAFADVQAFETSTVEGRMKNAVKEAWGNVTEMPKFFIGGAVDLTRGYGKMLSWVGEQYRRIESLPREAAETSRKSELARQVAEAAKKRLEVAKAEMADIANLASEAEQDWRRTFTQERDALREQIDALERARLERISAITKQPEARITKQILQRQQANIEAKMGTLKPQYELLVQQLATLEALTPEAQQNSASA